jgi:CRISPR-associated endonuclease/helicase Cas3
MQRRMPFRQSMPDTEYVLCVEDEGEEPRFYEVEADGGLKLCDKTFERIQSVIAKGVSIWGKDDMAAIAAHLAEAMDRDLGYVSRRFGVLRLRQGEQRWLYSPALGVHCPM